MTTTPTEIALLRAVAKAARDVDTTDYDNPYFMSQQRLALRALDAYQPPVEATGAEATAEWRSWAKPHGWDTVADIEAELGRPSLTPLSPAAREARKPRPPGELVEAVMDRVHEDVTMVCPNCTPPDRMGTWTCQSCHGTGQVPVSRPARSQKVMP